MNRLASVLVVVLLWAGVALGVAVAKPRAGEPDGPQPSAAVTPLLQDGYEWVAAGRLDDALRVWERALALARLWKDRPGEALAQHERADCLARLGRLEATSAWQAAVTAWKRAGDIPRQAEALANVALLLIGEKPLDAKRYLQEAVALARSEKHRPMAAVTTLSNAAGQFLRQGRLSEAEHLLRVALNVQQQRAPQSLLMAIVLDGMGVLAQNRGDLVTARRWYTRALAIRQKLAPNSLDMASSLSNLGTLVQAQGDPKAARTYLQRSLSLHERLAPNSLQLATTVSNLGGVVRDMGDLVKARAYCQRALVIRERLAPDSLAVANSLHNLSGVIADQGDLAEARRHVQRALSLREKLAPDSPDLASSLTTLGDIALTQGDLTEAKKYTERSLVIWGKLAPHSQEMATSLANLGVIMQGLGDLEEANRLFRRSIDLRKKIAPHSLAMASGLTHLGSLARQRGDLVAAKQFFQEAFALRKQPAPQSLDMALSLDDLAGLATVQGDLKGAWQLFQTALAIREKRAPGSLAVAVSLNNLGTMRQSQGDLEGALSYLRRALTIEEKLAPYSFATASTLHNLGAVARDQGDLQTARQYHQRELSIHERIAPNSLKVADSLNALGVIVQAQGDLTEAQQLLERALAIQEKAAPHSLATALSLDNLGSLVTDQGNLAAARVFLDRGLSIREKRAPDSLEVAHSLNSLGEVAHLQGDLAAARAYHQRALTIRERLTPASLDTAASLHNLGSVLHDLGDLAAARTYYQRALTLKEKAAGKSVELAVTLNSLGTAAQEQGDLTAARGYFQRVLTLMEELAPGSLGVAHSLMNLGSVARSQGQLPEATGLFQRSLAIVERLAPDSLAVALRLRHLASLAAAQRDLLEADQLAQRAWNIVRQQGTAVAGDEARQIFGDTFARYARDSAIYQLALGKHEAAFVTQEEGRAQALQQLLAERRIEPQLVSPSLWNAYKAAVADLNAAQQALAQAATSEGAAERQVREAMERATPGTLRTRAQAQQATARRRREAASTTYTAARLRMQQRWLEVKRSAPAVFPEPLTISQARRAVPPEGLFLSFTVNETETLLFLLSSAEGQPVRGYLLPFGRQQLAQEVEAWRLRLGVGIEQRGTEKVSGKRSNPSDRDEPFMAASRALFEKLFPREAQAAIRRARRLLISPDGPLWDLPFAALVFEERGSPRHLGLVKPLTYTPALFLSARLQQQTVTMTGSPAVLVVGNPLLEVRRSPMAAGTVAGAVGNGNRGMGDASPPGERSSFLETHLFPSLPYAETEAQEVATGYRVRPVLGAAATERAVRERMARAGVIHLATHGYLHPYQAMASGLLLAAPEKPTTETASDGVLQAWEIFSELRLQAELVVLSACETGRGAKVRGEGLIGLTRALQYAGARSVVVSQWPVSDPSTAALMVAFHQRLRAGEGKDEALLKAMAAVRERWPSPYHWAAFLLVGDPRNHGLRRSR